MTLVVQDLPSDGHADAHHEPTLWLTVARDAHGYPCLVWRTEHPSGTTYHAYVADDPDHADEIALALERCALSLRTEAALDRVRTPDHAHATSRDVGQQATSDAKKDAR